MGVKHIVYETFCADGSCLPPVIFCNSEMKKDEYDSSVGRAFIHYVPNAKGPGEYTTLAYIDDMSNTTDNFFGDEPHMIFDSLKGHTTPKVTHAWVDAGVTVYRIPAAGGKWANPCDNIINREFRRQFNK